MKYSLLLLCGITALLITSCSKDFLYEKNASDNNLIPIEVNMDFDSKPIKLGKKLDNPYSVRNMKLALEKLRNEPNGEEYDKFKIKTTDLYVRILPRNSEELDKLEKTGVELYEYPLDYEILSEGGTSYHDPNLPTDNHTYQYLVVKPNFKLKDYEHVVLEELYLPDSEDELTLDRFSVAIKKLERESFKLTNNEEVDEHYRGKYYPSGRIRVSDDRKGIVGVQGAKVRARRWFTTKVDYTSFSGSFYISYGFRGPVNYSIVWEGNGWDIRDGRWAQAYFNGPQMESFWDLTISSGKSLWYAMTHEAVYDHFNNHVPGMISPKRTILPAHDVPIAVINDWSTEVFTPHVVPFVANSSLPEVFLYVNGRSASEIYALACHELAHITHIDKINPTVFINYPFSNNAKFVIESYAEGVEYEMSRRRYGSYGDNLARDDSFQQRVPSNSNEYTSLVVDLMDSFNQSNVDDNVSGISIPLVQSSLNNVETWDGWRNRLQNLNTGNSSTNLHILFANWNP